MGQIRAVIVCRQHPDVILSGRHSSKAGAGKRWDFDCEEKAQQLKVSHKAAEELVAIHCNVQRTVPMNETKERIVGLAKLLQAEGVPQEHVASKVVELVPGFTRQYIYELLPDEFKDRKRSDAIRNGIEARSIKDATKLLSGFSLVGGSGGYPIDRHEPPRKTYTEAEMTLHHYFNRAHMSVNSQFLVPMDKWKCVKCRRTWIEEPPEFCPFCRLGVERLTYKVDLMVNGWAAVEPGLKGEFRNEEERDEFLRARGYEPFHFSNELVKYGAWLIVEHIRMLDEQRRVKKHTLTIEGRVRLVRYDDVAMGTATQINLQGNCLLQVKSVS
jgi:hypothetical protein